MRPGGNDEPPLTEEQAAQWAQADANNEITADVNAGVEDDPYA